LRPLCRHRCFLADLRYDAALESRTAEIARLEEQLRSYEGYESVKEELSVLKGIEFGVGSTPRWHTLSRTNTFEYAPRKKI
jgi:hypothetical protein